MTRPKYYCALFKRKKENMWTSSQILRASYHLSATLKKIYFFVAALLLFAPFCRFWGYQNIAN